MRIFPSALCVAQFFLIGATAMSAQDSSYDENALRVESVRGGLQIVQGIPGTVVARSGVFHGPKVASLVTRSDEALAQARVFERDFEPGQYAIAIGIATLGAAIGAWRISGVNPAVPTGLTIVSVSLITYGGTKLESAYRALSKAIWWYNRDLRK